MGMNQTPPLDHLDKYVITIDGPAASGKTSVSRELARRLGCNWVSTGSFYRGLGYAAQKNNIDLNDSKKLISLVGSSCWSVEMSDLKTIVLFNGHDVTDEVSSEEIGAIASQISQDKDVRLALLDAQRNCIFRSKVGLVAEGRDCGTVVFPNATIKFYLTANENNRAARRAAEQGLSHDETIEMQKARDLQDSTRKAAPLQIPKDSFVIDTSKMTFIEVVQFVESYVLSKLSIFRT